MIKLKIDMNPQGKARPRFRRTGRAYTPAKTKQAEDIIREAWLTQSKMSFEKGTPLKLTLVGGYPVAKSISKKQRALMLSGLIRPTVKPDLDNFAKLVLDSLNGYAYHDDAQVITFKEPFCKFYAETPFIGVIIEEIKEEESRLEVDLAKRIFNAN
jgi:Holliday junction resolvase RusA-like endonuclease